MSHLPTHQTLPYGVAIHQAIAEGNLAQMKTLLEQGEQHLRQYGDLHTAVDQLKQEISRLERR
ncbi:DUF1843 domain-containing protein [Chromobacterium alkanivorans]|uniref:DUF1843 domain-containing protein n=1 Tax=Chromobacterium fluminis TaxID=3044269 RepID=A0ABX0L8L9_9NEIS|nr:MULTISPECIES: DUF1843 domain-containing protein [Chromobacterium]MBN3002991.1 DUF1843 domain-containing protein [Chromobacterium alkanivorans]NHR05443.1 DUF1843 domain-containing protein [Chromobacterium haemolyticum]OQS39424.1 hypothetical protein B0T39_12565 [Chromobacterium haemolyticum]